MRQQNAHDEDDKNQQTTVDATGFTLFQISTSVMIAVPGTTEKRLLFKISHNRSHHKTARLTYHNHYHKATARPAWTCVEAVLMEKRAKHCITKM